MNRLLKCEAEALTGDSVNCKGRIAYQGGATACDIAESLEHYCAAELRAQRL
jgi:hypothetical protein